MIEDDIKNILSDIAAIRSADSYQADYICHGSACDSSSGQSRRMAVVLQAERDFVAQHQHEILQMAADRLVQQLVAAKTAMMSSELGIDLGGE